MSEHHDGLSLNFTAERPGTITIQIGTLWPSNSTKQDLKGSAAETGKRYLYSVELTHKLIKRECLEKLIFYSD